MFLRKLVNAKRVCKRLWKEQYTAHPAATIVVTIQHKLKASDTWSLVIAKQGNEWARLLSIVDYFVWLLASLLTTSHGVYSKNLHWCHAAGVSHHTVNGSFFI